MWGDVRIDVEGVEKCGRVYGVSGMCMGEVREDVGGGVGNALGCRGGNEKCGECGERCGRVYGVSGEVC